VVHFGCSFTVALFGRLFYKVQTLRRDLIGGIRIQRDFRALAKSNRRYGPSVPPLGLSNKDEV